MGNRRTIFSQLLEYAPRKEFARCVERHKGNHNVRSFSCWDQFVCMVFAQLTNRESLRDIEICLRGMGGKLYRCGLRGKVSRSTLADSNDKRSSQIYRDYCKVLIVRAQKLYRTEASFNELVKFAYALDSSWIKLCLELCPWARFGNHSSGLIKLHALLDLRGSIPAFVSVSPANINDFLTLDTIPFPPGSFVAMDKGYFDLGRLAKLSNRNVYFVIRKKKHVSVRVVSQNLVDESMKGVVSDKIVRFRGRFAKKKYPEQIRLIRFRDDKNNKVFLFLTNNFVLPAPVVCDLYKHRWKIELFFRWIKQHLRVTNFFGTSLNSVETQIWIATSAYLLVAIAKKKLGIKQPLYQMIQLFGVSIFEEIPIFQALSDDPSPIEDDNLNNQLKLF